MLGGCEQSYSRELIRLPTIAKSSKLCHTWSSRPHSDMLRSTSNLATIVGHFSMIFNMDHVPCAFSATFPHGTFFNAHHTPCDAELICFTLLQNLIAPTQLEPRMTLRVDYASVLKTAE